MLKMLSTQTGGLLAQIAANQEEAIEESARLLAQAGAFEGTVYFACFDELQAIELNALKAAEPFKKLRPWTKHVEITDIDRVCIFTRHANQPDALALAHQLYDAFIPFAVVANDKEKDAGEMANLAYTYISIGIKKGLLPNELGERIVLPHTLAALFIYEAIKLSYDEILAGV
ncbi:DUF2529 family protein [Rummeliibacillus suwonensis]|jgi:hypothetical protein|uniref:DUF2529 family protein n=1 Tax=Rummeliibacillus suwonensis TaxID=1306154 RepID=UPI001AAEBFAA|nr:DUF2529 family protein [Rummeliibacillus suwonensis]MBO2535523.1 DUF2529 family protein [Rummeliibacillus suwonensis]